MYTLLKKEGAARRGEFVTVHGTVQTPAFMNVGTSAAIKGGISSYDLVDLKCQVELCNTYHLHVRPGDELIRRMGGLHKFMGWNRVSGFLSCCPAEDSGGGGRLQLPCGRPEDLHEPGDQYADPVKLRFHHRHGF